MQGSAHPLVDALARDLVLLMTLTALLVVTARARPRQRPRREHRGRCLVAAGLTWTAVLVVDVHVLGHGHATTLATDVALHLAGLLALYAGLLLWQPLGTRRHRTIRPEGARA
ncbi:MAG: hypothetical protein NTV28_04355 [Propionibacteriales bacterium]|nr:hypothetical protein [Propionibacteriales bacterium]